MSKGAARMNYLLEVCLTIALAIGVTPSLIVQPLIGQSNPAIPTLQKGISVQMPVTTTAMPMPDADKENATVVTITEDGSVYIGLNPTDASAVADGVRNALSSQAEKNLYIKADARTPYAQVVKVLATLRTAGVETPSLLTSQPDAYLPGALLPPQGLEVFVGPRQSSSSPAIVQLSKSEQRRSALQVNGEPALRTSLQNRLAQFFQNRSDSDKVVRIEADGRMPFADVVDLIDRCRSTGAKVVLATPVP
jgi:biopolymer transport protein ExbD